MGFSMMLRLHPLNHPGMRIQHCLMKPSRNGRCLHEHHKACGWFQRDGLSDEFTDSGPSAQKFAP
jgi:hypothetical protein